MSSYAVVNPATGEQVKEYPEASDADISAAIAAAEKAHAEWSQTTSVADRAGLIQKVADFHGERREELAAIAVKEMGKPMEQALGEVDFCVDIYGYYADNTPSWGADWSHGSASGGSEHESRPRYLTKALHLEGFRISRPVSPKSTSAG